MTRIFTDGAEMRDTLFWDAVSNVTVTDVDPVPHASGYCYRIAGNCYKNITALSECYLRFRMHSSNWGGDIWRFPTFRTDSSSVIYITVDVTGHIKVVNDSGILATSPLALNADQWYLIEIYIKIDDNPNGRFVVYQDGTKIIDFTGDTKYGTYTDFNNLYFSTDSPAILALDDLAFNDTAGGSDNSYCGDGVIIKVTPNGDGAHNNWHGSDGNDINNYELVDEYPKDDETTYVYHDGDDSGTQDQYALSDYDGTNKTILRIYPEARLRKTAAAAHTVKLGTLASGGADAMSAAMDLTIAYARYVGDEQTINPVDSQPWEEADIDALEFVVEVG